MKIILKLSILIFTCYSASCFAQSSLGFFVSYDAVKVLPFEKNRYDTESQLYTSGFSVKSPYNYTLSDYFKLRSGLQYSKAGSNINNTSVFKLNYIRLPVAMQINMINERDWILYGLCGLYSGYNFSKKVMINGSNTEMSQLDFGFQAGSGIELRWNDQVSLSFELNYLVGFKDVYKAQDYRVLTNRSLSFGTGINWLFNY